VRCVVLPRVFPATERHSTASEHDVIQQGCTRACGVVEVARDETAKGEAKGEEDSRGKGERSWELHSNRICWACLAREILIPSRPPSLMASIFFRRSWRAIPGV
jgi:hypothetical protein